MIGTLSIEGDADEEVVSLEESAPLIIEQSAIGLKRIDDAVPSGILALEPNRLLIKGEGTQKRLTPMPGKDHLLGRLAPDVLSHIPLQHLIAHLLALRRCHVSVELFLLKIIAIGTGEVAERPGRLRHHVERTSERISDETTIHYDLNRYLKASSTRLTGTTLMEELLLRSRLLALS